MAGTILNVTELDFDQIKSNLKNFLKQQTEFNDYDFDGSGLSVLLDVLAYNTHYNALNAHYSLNEAFLDSAQIRGNVVTRAKLLGYVPRSILAPRATVDISVDTTGESQIANSLTLPRGAKLKTNVSGDSFNYVVLSDTSVTHDATNNRYLFPDVQIAQGVYKSMAYRVDNDIENQKFQLSDKDADTSTLRVRVQETQGSTAFEVYTKFETLLSGFPAGTVSGAPKIRAMEIINELEPLKRGIYSGAVGYFSSFGDMDTAIALRTAIIKDNQMYVQAGGGVVYDSDEEYEFNETLNKAQALFSAARDVFSEKSKK